MFLFPTVSSSVQATHNPRLVISEVHPNTTADGSSAESHEWVEIHNLGGDPINLKDWTLEDAQAIASLPDFTLEPGGTVLVVGSSSDIVVPAGESLIILESRTIGSGLRNAGDRVALINPQGVRYDAVSWGDVRWPRASDPPNPRQSIIRTSSGGQSLTDDVTPWTVGEAISAAPERHRHPRPDTSIRIIKASIDPADGEPESVTLKNISNEPLLTVNWSLTVGDSLVKLRSVRINPGESYTVTAKNGRLGSGLSAEGGHLVLRDPKGNWLATASWGTDETFHRLPSPSQREELRFSPWARIHPRIPWFETFDDGRLVTIPGRLSETAPQYANAASLTVRERQPASVSQQSEEPAVWISEVYPTAGQGRDDHKFEWFELTNSTGQEHKLDGWSIADNTSSDPLDGVIIPPGASVVIGASGEAEPEVVVAITDGRIGNGLANAGDQLRLIDPEGEVASAISWGTDREFTSVRSPKSDESIHRRSSNTAPTVGAPSPGRLNLAPIQASSADAANPQGTVSEPPEVGAPEREVEQLEAPAASESISTSLRITEILPAPLPGQPEWVEIHNPSDRALDLSGWEIGDAEGRTELSGVLPARSRLVITVQELELDKPMLLVKRIGNGLNNDGDTIYLYDADGLVVDYVRYGDDTLPSPDRGLSLALEPQRWLVTATPTPGDEGVTPLLDDSFRSASIKPPISDEGRLPIVDASPDDGSDAWMIVSFALIGVILTLIIRRWRPDEPTPDPVAEPTTYSGPAGDHSSAEELERSDEQPGR